MSGFALLYMYAKSKYLKDKSTYTVSTGGITSNFIDDTMYLWLL